MSLPSRTPGSYYQENMPSEVPAIAPVTTSIPVFIGYTEKALGASESFLQRAIKISSFAEYEAHYGGAPVPVPEAIPIDAHDPSAVPEPVWTQGTWFYMHDSVRLFYDNGGGDCYIVSVGLYGSGETPVPVVLGDEEGPTGLFGGLAVAALEAEPAILLFPDAVLLGKEDLYRLQREALARCEALGSRVAILDLPSDGAGPEKDFRDAIGGDHLSFGAAYTPWLYTNYHPIVDYKAFRDKLYDASGKLISDLSQLTADKAMNALVIAMESSLADLAVTEAAARSLIATSAYPEAKTLEEAFDQYIDAIGRAVGDEANQAAWHAILDWTDDRIMPLVSGWKGGACFAQEALRADIASSPVLAFLQKEAATWPSDRTAHIAVWEEPLKPAVPGSPPDRTSLSEFFRQVAALLSGAQTSAAAYVARAQQRLYARHPVIGPVAAALARKMQAIPPGGAVAGVYAATDKARGVWAAPANTVLRGISGPESAITDAAQALLTLDPATGISINAIRTFAGKGTLVWGARTLAGNDPDWRYISVRRFCIMAEQSCSRAVQALAGQPNDVATWTKVQAMIENFLTLEWRAGALQGTKTTDAFYVAVGLGKTMTDTDVLAGRMIVELGLALIRPAEFILLRFTQLMDGASG